MMNGFVWILSAVMWGKVLCMCGVDASCVRTLTLLTLCYVAPASSY